MKRTLYICVTGLTAVVSLAMAQDGALPALSEVVVRGEGNVPSRRMVDWLDLAVGRAISDEVVQSASHRLLLRLLDEGYFFARVDSVSRTETSGGVRLEFAVSEGPQVVLGEVHFQGVGEKGRSRLNDDWRLPSGRRLSVSELRRQMQRIVYSYENLGYPYCQVELVGLELASRNGPAEQMLDLALRVDPGPRVVISRIDLRGNSLTRRPVILRELGVREGDLYSRKRVDDISRRLRNLGYFKKVEEPVLLQNADGSGRLVITVEEGNANRFDGVLGYNPGTTGRGGYLTGLLDVSFGNLFGSGRRIDARWEKRGRQTQQLQLAYREPWVAGLPVNADVGFQQLARDTTYLQRSWFLGLQFPVGRHVAVGGRLSGESVTPDSVGRGPFAVPRSRALSAGLSLQVGTLDDPLNPRSGVVYSTSVETGRKRIEAGPNETRTFTRKRLSVDVEAYFPIRRWHVVAVGLHGRQVTTGEPFVSLSDNYRLGGALTLRGYREEQFRGSRVAWSNLEYRYLLGPASRAFAFLDAGYFWRQEESGVAEGLKIGYGLGMSVATRLGVVSIAYGLGEGDGLMDGKVHLRLVNRF